MASRERRLKAVKPLAPPVGATATKPRSRLKHEPIDEINRAIITELQNDGRRSYTAIAQSVGLSEAAVRQRVQKLIDDGVMQIVAITDPFRLGFRRMAMVGMRIDGDATSVAEALSKVPEVAYVAENC